MPKSSKSRSNKPQKPYPSFPLTPHPQGYWCKSIRGKLRYFGRWGRVRKGKMEILPNGGEWAQALQQYEREAPYLFSGKPVPPSPDGLTTAELCNRFLTAKWRQVQSGELTARTFGDYKRSCDALVAAFGKDTSVVHLTADDFSHLRAVLAERNGPVRLANEIQRVRSVFKFAYDSGWLDRPVRFGPSFKPPAKHIMRKHRASNGSKMFSAEECRQLIEHAHTPELRCMILLGLNCGFGNSDCAKLPIAAVDLQRRWINFPRPKTGIERRCPLWAETAEALQEVLARGKPDRDLVFLTKYGNDFGKDQAAITKEFRKLLDRLGLYRRGRSFYSLRHVFRTVADATRDWPAVRLVMGHADDSIDATYRETIEDARLVAVVEHVRRWLFGEET